MKLIYIWLKDYKLIKEHGFNLSTSYMINLISNNNKLIFHIEKSKKHFNLYNSNILDVGAIIGENGSGKTTLAEALLEFSPEQINLLNLNSKTKYVSIYEDVPKHKLHVYFSGIERSTLHINHDKEIEIEYVNLRENYGSSNMSAILISNAFDVNKLHANFLLGDLRINNCTIQQIYNPASILRNIQEKERKNYNGFNYKFISYNEKLYDYAKKMSDNIIELYRSEQAKMLLSTYLNASEEVKKELNIFDNIKLVKKDFADYFDLNRYKGDDLSYNQYEIQIEFFKRKFLELSRRLNKDNDIAMHIVFCIFSEIYMGCLELFEQYETEIVWYESSNEDNQLNYISASKASIQKLIDKLNQDIKDSDETNTDKNNYYKFYVTFLNDYLEQIENLEAWIGKLSFGDHHVNEIRDFLTEYKEQCNKSNSLFTRYVKLEFCSASTGEYALVNLFAYIHSALETGNQNKDILLIIDEIDIYMHPKWQQQVMYWLCRWLELDEICRQYNFQIIITTHSPLVLSDFPKHKILRLFSDKEQGVYSKSLERETFGANILNLYYDSFVLDRGSIGLKAEATINKWLLALNEFSSVSKTNWDDNENEKIKQLYSAFGTNDMQQIAYMIDSIGEDIIRVKMKEMLMTGLSYYDKEAHKNNIRNEILLLEQRRAALEKELKKL